ncbi:MAG: hypothetical protein QRY74_03765 [Chlamydia sp.]
MKRFFTLLALVAAPVVVSAADVQLKPVYTNSTDRLVESFNNGPKSALAETCADRTSWKLGFNKSSSAAYSVNTIQPLYRDASMDNTVFLQAGIGMEKWHRSLADIGVGYRYLSHNGDNMFGASLFYFDGTGTHKHLSNHLGADISWFTPFTTVSLGRSQKVKSFKGLKTWTKFARINKETTTLDVSVQLPYLPWTTLTVGKAWRNNCKFHNLKKLNYGLTLNIAGPLAVEMGYNKGFHNKGYVNFVLTFGRPAVREHTLMDGFVSEEILAPRDLKNHTLAPVTRALI